MNAQQEEALDVLNRLIGICRDGQEGFRTAAEAVVDDPELKMLLSSFSLQRAKFAGDLEAEAITMGEHHPENEGSTFRGAAHRGWIHLKGALSRGSNHALLAECERGEDVAKEAYQRALRHDLPAPVYDLIQEQRQEVITTHNTIRALRDAAHLAGRRKKISGGRKDNNAEVSPVTRGAVEIWHEVQTRNLEAIRRDVKSVRRRHLVMTLLRMAALGSVAVLAVYWLRSRNRRLSLRGAGDELFSRRRQLQRRLAGSLPHLGRGAPLSSRFGMGRFGSRSFGMKQPLRRLKGRLKHRSRLARWQELWS
ncbi:MAG TPA: PA2169 family four-helix-bundle protein [Chthoniobacteraceae bacterium]|nr:PA2169 family four-helix-bundle protein [Chthoniobacteraceae bacterium]